MQDWVIQGPFCKVCLLAACLLWVHPVQAVANVSVVSIPETPLEGQNVTLSVENVMGTIRQFDWYRGQATDGGTRIFTYFPGYGRPQRNGVQFTQREFALPNGSLLISGVRASDAKPYTVVILVRPKGTLKGTIDLSLAGSTTKPPPVTFTSLKPPAKEPAKVPWMMGWIVAGVVVGILLAGALGAAVVYRFVLQKADPGSGVAGKLDARVKKPPVSKHDDKEPIYEVMDSPVESPKIDGKGPPPIPGPHPPLPGTGPKLDSNYMDLLCRAESIYSEIKR